MGIKRVRLGRTGVKVSAISVGTWAHGGPNTAGATQIGWSGHDDSLALDALRRAHEQGMDHWDTADVYGNGHAERLIGSLWGEIPRDRIFLASKVGWFRGPYDQWYHPDLVRQQLEASLRNLRTDHIDLYYLHHCDFGPGGRWLEPALEIVRQAQRAGKVRFVGLSDWDSAKIMDFIDVVDPDVVQPYHNVADPAWDASGLAERARSTDLGVAFFSPLKQGLLLGKYDAPTTFPDGDFRNEVPEFRDADVIARMRRNRDLLRTRYASHREPVLHGVVDSLFAGNPTACVLQGMRNPAQVDAAATLGVPLSGGDAAWVRSLYRA